MIFFVCFALLNIQSQATLTQTKESRLSVLFSGLLAGLQKESGQISSCQKFHKSFAYNGKELISGLLTNKPILETIINFNSFTNDLVSIIDICNYPKKISSLVKSSEIFLRNLLENLMNNFEKIMKSCRGLLIALKSDSDYYNIGFYLGKIIKDSLDVYI
jgi:hypothetical protein